MSYTRFEILSSDPKVAFAVERKSQKADAPFDAMLYYNDELPSKLKVKALSEVIKGLESLIGLSGLLAGTTAPEEASSSGTTRPTRGKSLHTPAVAKSNSKKRPAPAKEEVSPQPLSKTRHT